MRTYPLFLSLFLFHFANAAPYSLTDLKQLIQDQSFLEAHKHLEDIPPSQRNADWKAIAVASTLGVAELEQKNSPYWAYQLVRNTRDSMGPLSQEKVLIVRQIDLGIEALRSKEMGSHEEIEKIAKELLKLDPNTIVRLVTETRYLDSERQFFRWLLENTNQALSLNKNNPKIKEYTLKELADLRPQDDEIIQKLKVDAVKKMGWFEESLKNENEKLREYGNALMRGDFTYDQQALYLQASLDKKNGLDPDATARVSIPLLLMSGSNPEPLLNRLRKIPAGTIQKVEKELIALPATRDYWFSGEEWKSEPLAGLKKILPLVVQTALQECRQLKKQNPTQTPAQTHIRPTACEWLK